MRPRRRLAQLVIEPVHEVVAESQRCDGTQSRSDDGNKGYHSAYKTPTERPRAMHVKCHASSLTENPVRALWAWWWCRSPPPSEVQIRPGSTGLTPVDSFSGNEEVPCDLR